MTVKYSPDKAANALALFIDGHPGPYIGAMYDVCSQTALDWIRKANGGTMPRQIRREAEPVTKPEPPSEPQPNPIDANGRNLCQQCRINSTHGSHCSPCAIARVRGEKTQTMAERNATHYAKVMAG